MTAVSGFGSQSEIRPQANIGDAVEVARSSVFPPKIKLSGLHGVAGAIRTTFTLAATPAIGGRHCVSPRLLEASMAAPASRRLRLWSRVFCRLPQSAEEHHRRFPGLERS